MEDYQTIHQTISIRIYSWFYSRFDCCCNRKANLRIKQTSIYTVDFVEIISKSCLVSVKNDDDEDVRGGGVG